MRNQGLRFDLTDKRRGLNWLGTVRSVRSETCAQFRTTTACWVKKAGPGERKSFWSCHVPQLANGISCGQAKLSTTTRSALQSRAVPYIPRVPRNAVRQHMAQCSLRIKPRESSLGVYSQVHQQRWQRFVKRVFHASNDLRLRFLRVLRRALQDHLVVDLQQHAIA